MLEEYKKATEFLNVLDKSNIQIGIWRIGVELCRFCLFSPSDKSVNGCVYTPKKIRWIGGCCPCSVQIDKVDANIKICDPACGFVLDPAYSSQRE